MKDEIIEAIRSNNERQVTELREMARERDEALQELASFRAAMTCALFDDHQGDLPSVAELVEESTQLKKESAMYNETLQEFASFRLAMARALFPKNDFQPNAIYLPSVEDMIVQVGAIRQQREETPHMAASYVCRVPGCNCANVPRVTDERNTVRVVLTSEAFGLLYRLTGMGIFGKDPTEVATRFIDQALQAFVEQPKLRLP